MGVDVLFVLVYQHFHRRGAASGDDASRLAGGGELPEAQIAEFRFADAEVAEIVASGRPPAIELGGDEDFSMARL
jgi:hypothetical protein